MVVSVDDTHAARQCGSAGDRSAARSHQPDRGSYHLCAGRCRRMACSGIDSSFPSGDGGAHFIVQGEASRRWSSRSRRRPPLMTSLPAASLPSSTCERRTSMPDLCSSALHSGPFGSVQPTACSVHLPLLPHCQSLERRALAIIRPSHVLIQVFYFKKKVQNKKKRTATRSPYQTITKQERKSEKGNTGQQAPLTM